MKNVVAMEIFRWKFSPEKWKPKMNEIEILELKNTVSEI